MFYASMKRFKTRTKHNNIKMVIDGQRFDSRREYQRFCELRLEERAGVICDLQRQVMFVLAPSVVLNGRKKPPLRYVADFVYTRAGQLIVEDAKSPHLKKDPYFRAKKHLMMYVHKIDIREV